MKKKIIFLVSGMNSWENTLPLIHKLNENKYNITLGLETAAFFDKFVNDPFRKAFLKNKNIFFLHLGKPRNLKEYFFLFYFYLCLIWFKYNFIIETIDFDIDLRISNFFLKFQIIKGCKRIKNYSDSMTFHELRNTQIFYQVLNLKKKILNLKKYNAVLLSNDFKEYQNIHKEFVIFPDNKDLCINIGKPKFDKEWVSYILKFYKYENKIYDILIPLSATTGNFLKGNNAVPQEEKLSKIFSILNSIGKLNIVLKPHSKTDLKIINDLKKIYKSINVEIKTSHLYHLIENSKIILTYHPTSAQICSKIFDKKLIEYGDYDPRIEKALGYKPRYYESVNEWIKKDEKQLKIIIVNFLKSYKEKKNSYDGYKYNKFLEIIENEE